MNRLLGLQRQLVSQSQSSFQSYRKRSTIDKDQFNRIVYGPNYMERVKILNVISQNSDVFEHFHLTEAPRAQQRQKTTNQIFFVKKYLNISDQQGMKNNPNKFTLRANGITFYDLNLITRLGVHYSLYIKTIERLGTAKHQPYYQRACKWNDIGCFGLTELMHGSNVRGILTEAHYDYKQREIIIHSPSRDAMKFWIGGAAKSANITIIWAQLYIQHICYGVHAFIVPLRDSKTHKVLPGIIIGDCGPKFGLNAVDNGFIIFNQFRIPVDNLLNRISGINEKGQFFSTVEGENKRFGMTLLALSEGRLYVCCHSNSLALSALAIALRYTFVRRQFSKKSSEKQTLLIDYPLTKRRMIPLLAQEIIYMTVTMNTFYEAQSNQERNALNSNNALLQQIHAISCVLKSKAAWVATETIRQCRQMMGGHGYSAYSKMGALYSANDVNNTWQGQNHVILQQTTKYVLENFQKSLKGKPILSPTLKFLADPPTDQPFEITKQSLLNFSSIQTFLKKKIWTKVQEMGIKMMNLKQQKIPSADIWNSTQVYLGQLIAINTGDLFILNSCIERLSQIKDENNKRVFQNILHLWTLLMIRNDDLVGQEHHGLIENVIMEYCNLLTPQILGLLEVVAAGEEVLGSPFADEKGEGFNKYVNLVLQQPRKEKAGYWKAVASG